MKHKIAFIGPVEIHEAFGKMEESWDMQVPLPTLESFRLELSESEETARISKETSVTIFFSRLFQSNPKEFAELVAFIAPYSVCCILIPSQDVAAQKDIIEQEIKEAQSIRAQSSIEYNSNTPFYFVSYDNPQQDIYEAIAAFVKSTIISEDIKNAIKVMLPSAELEFEVFENYKSEDDEAIVIPKADSNAKGQVIAVTSSKGGSGKSTVSIGIGAYIAKASIDAVRNGLATKPLKVCIVDLDVRDGQLGFLNGVNTPSVVNIAFKGAPNENTVKEGIYHSDKLDCDFIFAAKRPRNAKEFPPVFYAEVIQILRSMYDIVILDTSVNYLDPLLEEVAYPIADKIVFVTDMGISSIFGCKRWIIETTNSKEIGVKQIPREKIGIVINKAMKNCNMGYEKIEQSTDGLPILGVIPNCPQLVLYAANTFELGQILNERSINQAFKQITANLVDEPLGNV